MGSYWSSRRYRSPTDTPTEPPPKPPRKPPPKPPRTKPPIEPPPEPPADRPPILTDAHPDWDFLPTDDANTSFASLHFAEGVSRRAYKAMRWKQPHKLGTKAVVKDYKHEYKWAQSDWNTAVSLYDKAIELAKEFNHAMTTGREIHIVDYIIEQVTSRPDNTTGPMLNEYVLVEDYLEGEFESTLATQDMSIQPAAVNTY